MHPQSFFDLSRHRAPPYRPSSSSTTSSSSDMPPPYAPSLPLQTLSSDSPPKRRASPPPYPSPPRDSVAPDTAPNSADQQRYFAALNNLFEESASGKEKVDKGKRRTEVGGECAGCGVV